MRYGVQVLVTSVSLLLLAGAIWANTARTPLSETRGLWVTQATRGMAY